MSTVTAYSRRRPVPRSRRTATSGRSCSCASSSSADQVWQALTDPAQLSQWAPFDADRNLGGGGPVKLTTVGAPTAQVSETR